MQYINKQHVEMTQGTILSARSFVVVQGWTKPFHLIKKLLANVNRHALEKPVYLFVSPPKKSFVVLCLQFPIVANHIISCLVI